MSEQTTPIQVRLPNKDSVKNAELTFTDTECLVRLAKYEFLEESAQLDIRRTSDGGSVISHGNRPGMVKDYMPRTVWVTIDDQPATLLDAKMSIDDGMFWTGIRQQYSASRVLYGAHLASDDHPVDGIRFVLAAKTWREWFNQEPAAFVHGTVGLRHHETGMVGIEVVLHEPVGVGDIENRTLLPLQALFQLWTYREAQDGYVEVRTPEHGWLALHDFIVPQSPRGTPSMLLPVGELTTKTLAKWLDIAQQLGPIPYMAVHRTGAIQVDALVITAALEGCHRRLARGLTDADIYYRTRVSELVGEVQELVPGLFGPSIHKWTAEIRNIRNEQGHVFANIDDFDEAHISRYYVHHAGAEWLLRLFLLLQVADRKLLSTYLQRSDRLLFALANIDREAYWAEYSAYEAFSEHCR